MNNIALVTGATSGIGKACAEILAENGYHLIITGRRSDRLEKFGHQLKDQYKVEVLTLNFDVRDREKVEKILNSIPEKWKNINVLVNNAGLAAGFDPIHTGNMDDWEQMMDTNVKGLLFVSRAIIPFMVARKEGHIINIASIAGKEVYPKGNVYCASKHAVDALSKGMRMDLLQFGIKVTNIAPGLVETEFSEVRLHGDKVAAKNVYNGIEPLSGKDVADAVWYAVSRPKHVQVADIVIMPLDQASSTHVNRK